MRLKSFYGSTMTEAMRLVRESMGEGAIIVATRDDPQTGGVRVTAALDETAVEPPRATGFAAEPAGPDSMDVIASALVEHKVPSALAEKILATATPFAGEDLLVALGAALDVHLAYAPAEGERPLMLIGPPGAGKTLCVAKLATRAALDKRKTALIGTDTQRAGGMAQLDAFARVLKTDILEIEDAPALCDAVAIQPKDAFILIDTAGCNPFDPAARQALAAFLKEAPVDPCLVLPADWDAEIACEAAKAFAALGAKKLIATRLDMAPRLGGLLRAAHESRLPLYLFGAGAKVTEPLSPFNPVSLARLILPNRADVSRQAAGGVR